MSGIEDESAAWLQSDFFLNTDGTLEPEQTSQAFETRNSISFTRTQSGGDKTARAPLISAELWASHRNQICDLYIQQELPLQQVRQIMAHRFGFFATQNQYKRKLKTWNISKVRKKAAKSSTHESDSPIGSTIEAINPNAYTLEATEPADIQYRSQNSVGLDSGYHTAANKDTYTTSDEHKPAERVRPESIYSYNSSITTDPRQHRLEALASKLFAHMNAHHDSNGMNAWQLTRFDNLLRMFALRLGFEGQSSEHLRSMVFIHKHRREIVAIVQDQLQKHVEHGSNHLSNEDQQKEGSKESVRSYVEKVDGWRMSLYEEFEPFKEPENIEIDEDINEAEVYDVYSELVLEPKAYTWLCGQVSTLLKLSGGPQSTLEAIRTDISETLTLISQGNPWATSLKTADSRLRAHISRIVAPPAVRLVVSINWDLRTYIEQQSTGIRARGAEEPEVISLAGLRHAITLSGSATDAQALTCGEYLEQTWPSTGRTILRFIQLTAHKHGEIIQCRKKSTKRLSAISYLSSLFMGDHLMVQIDGEEHAVAEICEILAWLSSSLRESPLNNGICACEPFIVASNQSKTGLNIPDALRVYMQSRLGIETIHDSTPPMGPAQGSVRLNNSRPSDTAFIDIDFRLTPLESQKPGRCWHEMFHNPVLVQGFPTLSRDKYGTGLEVSLSIVSAILRTDRVTVLNQHSYIKAFSSMLVPTDQIDGAIIWHYMYDKQGNYLPYSRCDVEHLPGIRPEMIISSRHIVGLCSMAQLDAGSARASLSVQKSGLDSPRQSIALKGFTISGGRFISTGITATIGHKDPSLRVKFVGKPIVDQLEEISRQFVVLWDCGPGVDRGVLVDGLTALLYLLRVYIHNRRQSLFASTLILEDKDIYEPLEPYPAAAARFFTGRNYQNLRLRLFIHGFEAYRERTIHEGNPDKETDKESYVLLQNRVEDLLEVLFEAIDLQSKQGEREGAYYNGHLTSHLEGWDFKDIATSHFEFKPVSKSFPCMSLPWVDFARSINAVTLFGQDFGDLIKSVNLNESRHSWRTVPKGLNCLGVCVSTLRSIMDRHNGSTDTQPIKLNSKFFWHTVLDRPDRPQGPVHIIWPRGLQWRAPSSWKQPSVEADGAVIFGRQSRFPYLRDSRGVASIGQPVEALEDDIPSASNTEINQEQSDSSDSTRPFGMGSSTPPSSTSTEATSQQASNSNLTTTQSGPVPPTQPKREAQNLALSVRLALGKRGTRDEDNETTESIFRRLKRRVEN